MIEFKGYISGKAEKYSLKKSRRAVRIAMCGAILFLSPLPVIGSICTKNYELAIGVAILFVITFLASFIPISKKQKINFAPNRIYTEDEYIITAGIKFEEYNLIEDVVKVIDYGEFYDLIFPFGKKSDKFVCQKSLLTKGTLEEFEALFEGKIERRIKRSKKLYKQK